MTTLDTVDRLLSVVTQTQLRTFVHVQGSTAAVPSIRLWAVQRIFNKYLQFTASWQLHIMI